MNSITSKCGCVACATPMCTAFSSVRCLHIPHHIPCHVSLTGSSPPPRPHQLRSIALQPLLPPSVDQHLLWTETVAVETNGRAEVLTADQSRLEMCVWEGYEGVTETRMGTSKAALSGDSKRLQRLGKAGTETRRLGMAVVSPFAPSYA